MTQWDLILWAFAAGAAIVILTFPLFFITYCLIQAKYIAKADYLKKNPLSVL